MHSWASPILHALTNLTDIGFDEHAADTLYNNDNLSAYISEIYYHGPGGVVDWAKTSIVETVTIGM